MSTIYNGRDTFKGNAVSGARLDVNVTWKGTALPVGAQNEVPQNGLFLLVDSLSAPTVRTWYVQTSATISSPNFVVIPDATGLPDITAVEEGKVLSNDGTDPVWSGQLASPDVERGYGFPTPHKVRGIEVTMTNVFGVDPTANYPYCICVPPANGDFLYTNGNNNTIIRLKFTVSDTHAKGSYPDGDHMYYGNEFTGSAWGVFVGNGGTKLYIHTQTVVYQYTMSTPYLLSSATYDSKSYTLAGVTQGRGLFIHPSGTHFYVTDDAGVDVNRYTMSTPWDISTAGSQQTYGVGSQDGNPVGIFLNTDGTKMFVLGNDGNDVNEYSLSTPYQISSGVSFSTNKAWRLGSPSTPYSLTFNTDGTEMFVGDTNERIWRATMTTGFSVSTIDNFWGECGTGWKPATPSMGTDLNCGQWNDDGTKLYVLDMTTTTDTIYQFDVSPAYNLAGITDASKSKSVAAEDSIPQWFEWIPNGNGVVDGVEFHMIGDANDDMYQYKCSTPWDISTASYTGISKDFGVSYQSGCNWFGYSLDGMILFIHGTSQAYFDSFELAAPYHFWTARARQSGDWLGTTFQYLKWLTPTQVIWASSDQRVNLASLAIPYDISSTVAKDTLRTFVVDPGHNTLPHISIGGSSGFVTWRRDDPTILDVFEGGSNEQAGSFYIGGLLEKDELRKRWW